MAKSKSEQKRVDVQKKDQKLPVVHATLTIDLSKIKLR